MDKSELKTLLEALAFSRKLMARFDEQAAIFEAQMLDTIPGKVYQAIREECKQQAKVEEDLNSKIRAATIELYNANPEGGKKPAPGVGIRIVKRAKYDPLEARKYCLEKLPGLMDLNKEKFEKMATSGLYPFDFVTIEEFVTATIASDLSEYLPAEPSPAA